MALEMTTGKITLQDVAHPASISTATVSHVTNGSDQVETEIQARVLAASRQLGLKLTSGRKICNIAFVLGECNTLRLPSEPAAECH
jgi:DNA-binding LacI/PurR family transcriptional regulator